MIITNQGSCIHVVLINCLANYEISHQKDIFSFIEIWFTGQNLKSLEKEVIKNIALVID